LTNQEILDLLKRCSDALYYVYDSNALGLWLSKYRELSEECDEMIEKLSRNQKIQDALVKEVLKDEI